MGGMTSTNAPRPADICSYSSVVKLSISTNTQCLDRLLQVFNDLASRLIILLLEPVAKKKKTIYGCTRIYGVCRLFTTIEGVLTVGGALQTVLLGAVHGELVRCVGRTHRTHDQQQRDCDQQVHWEPGFKYFGKFVRIPKHFFLIF